MMRGVANVAGTIGLELLSPALALAQVPVVPPTPQQRTEDCRTPLIAIDELVCADPQGKVAGAATVNAGQSSWQPRLPLTRRQTAFAIRTNAGDKQRCRR